MTNTHALASIIEVALTVFFIWGLFNEEKLAVAEKKLFARLKKQPKISFVNSVNSKVADKDIA